MHFILFVILYLPCLFSIEYDCKYKSANSDWTVTYDLQALRLTASSSTGALGYHNVTDVDNFDPNIAGYYYIFNICGDTGTIPEATICDLTEADDQNYQMGYYDEDQQDFVLMQGDSPAWQVKYEAGEPTHCVRLGRSGGAFMSKSLIDPDFPTRGVAYEYIEGDSDSSGCFSAQTGVHHNRNFRMEFYCGQEEGDELVDPSNAEITEEDALCSYTMKFTTVEACPLECPRICGETTNDDGESEYRCKVCNGEGHCQLDAGLKVPRCFCNFGWEGSDCATRNYDEVAINNDDCASIGNGYYLQGLCKDENNQGGYDTFEASLFTNAECSEPAKKGTNGKRDYQANPEACYDLFNVGVLKGGIECLSEESAVIRTASCESTSGSSSNGGISGGVVAFIIIILLLVLGISAFVAYKSQKWPDLRNYLVLDESRDTGVQEPL